MQVYVGRTGVREPLRVLSEYRADSEEIQAPYCDRRHGSYGTLKMLNIDMQDFS